MCAVSVLFSNLHSKTPGGQDFTENIKHKVWLKVGLDCLEIVKSESLLSKQLVSHCLTNDSFCLEIVKSESLLNKQLVSHYLTKTLSVCLCFLADSQYTVCLSFSVHSYTWSVFFSSFQYMVHLCFLAHCST